MTQYRTKYRFVYIALWSAAAIILSIIESFIPMPPLIYGVKLGLANIVTMSALELLSPSDAFFITIVRCLVTGVLTGNIAALPWPFGRPLAWLVMAMVWRLSFGRVSFVGIAYLAPPPTAQGQICGGLIIGSRTVFMYLPFLMALSSAVGIFTGICANFAVFEFKNTVLGELYEHSIVGFAKKKRNLKE